MPLQNSCNVPVVRKRLDGILHIMERKNRLEVRVRSVGDAKTHTAAASRNTTGSPGGDFARYRGKAYRFVEPITCITHLMQLLQPAAEADGPSSNADKFQS